MNLTTGTDPADRMVEAPLAPGLGDRRPPAEPPRPSTAPAQPRRRHDRLTSVQSTPPLRPVYPQPGAASEPDLDRLLCRPPASRCCRGPTRPRCAAADQRDRERGRRQIAGRAGRIDRRCYGSNLSPTNLATSQIPLPTALANSCLTVNGQPMPLIFVSPTQINAQMPFQAVGDVTVVVHTPGGTSDNSI